ncbi:MAG TPA: type I-U CRISPR-associated protein Csb2, partial [Tepidisphaeraceae bacterium]|nr:type I-U CRISPR-associated protein Csb2 [Tepidisphaeraceae bacterium]
MNPSLCISFRFIQPQPVFHGRADAEEPEWPPSPMRAFQALVNAACLRTRGGPLSSEVRLALNVIEKMRPSIVAPSAALSTVRYRLYVPHNQADLVTAAWDRGNDDASIASHRTEKDFRPYLIETAGDDLPVIHYLYPFDASVNDPAGLLDDIRPSVRSIHCLGWGIDQVIADATLVDASSKRVTGQSWTPTARGGKLLRVHRSGSLEALTTRHLKSLNRLVQGEWTPVPPLTAFDLVHYRRRCDPVPRPVVIFKLIDADSDTVRYPQSKLIHIAGMVRHLAHKWMSGNPPRDLRKRGRDPAEWLRSYVMGHQSAEDKAENKPHTQFSYVPLQSIGMEHTDPGVRRVMIIAPLGDEDWLEHLAAQLDGEPLKPLDGTKLPPGTRLERILDRARDGVRDRYLDPSSVWASVTPVILDGHIKRKRIKDEQGREIEVTNHGELIRRALARAGIEQPCEFEWSPFSRFRK